MLVPCCQRGDEGQNASSAPPPSPSDLKVSDEFFTFLCFQGREQVRLSQLCMEGCMHRKPSSPSFLSVVSVYLSMHKQIICAILSSEESPKD